MTYSYGRDAFSHIVPSYTLVINGSDDSIHSSTSDNSKDTTPPAWHADCSR